VFATFPWPDLVTDDQRVAVAEASRRVIARRQEICVAADHTRALSRSHPGNQDRRTGW
jgi:hypothetical protein